MIPVEIGPLLVFIIFTIQSVVNDSPRLTTNRAFTSLAIITLMTDPAKELLSAYPSLVAAMGCLDRIQAFFLSETGQYESVTGHGTSPFIGLPRENDFEMRSMSPGTSDSPVVSIREADIRPTATAKNALSNIDFQVSRGSFTFVVGPVGSGKSTLLKAMLGEAYCSRGTVDPIGTDVAYCAQTPWLQNTLLRNAVCGVDPDVDMDSEWYQTVVDACALNEDIAQLPHGDDTMLGSRGVTLSGGQKQRLVCHQNPC